jgi:hypothetical protein
VGPVGEAATPATAQWRLIGRYRNNGLFRPIGRRRDQTGERQEFLRVLRLSVDSHLVMHVRAGAAAGRPDEPDFGLRCGVLTGEGLRGHYWHSGTDVDRWSIVGASDYQVSDYLVGLPAGHLCLI